MPITTLTVRRAVLQLSLAFTAVGFVGLPTGAIAQTPAAAPHATPQRGTVKSIDGSNLTITTDAGQQVVVVVSPAARIQRLAPGSTDLKTAETALLADVAVGDRILVTGAAGETPATFNANRLILMKSGDIAQRHEEEQRDWQRNGTGGIVNAVDASSGAITVSSGTRKLQVTTSNTTVFRRYADGSVKFEDAKPGTLAQIQVGDQVLARGAKSEDGASLRAEEIVSGSFRNLSGTIASIDPAKNSVSLKDLVTKRTVTVRLTENSAIKRLPVQAALMLAARAHSGETGSAAGGAAPRSAPGTATGAAASRPAGDASGATPAGTHAGGGPGRSSGGDLSQTVARLPAVPLSDLHIGDAVMIVAEQSSTDTTNLTAITLLAGVESILAGPGGSSAMTLSPWSVATGAPEGGGPQ